LQDEHKVSQTKAHRHQACKLFFLLSAAKQDRLKQARAEADREIAAYKAEREGAYQKKVSEVSPGSFSLHQACIGLPDCSAIQHSNVILVHRWFVYRGPAGHRLPCSV
jgi:hypothetical protein